MKKRVALRLFVLLMALIPMVSCSQQGQPNQSGQPVAAEQPNQVVQPQQEAPPPMSEPQKQPASQQSPSQPLFLDQPQQEEQPAQQVSPQQPPSPVQQAEPQKLPAQPQQQKPVIVGRISEVEGQLLRYVPDTSDWSATEKDNPAGVKDAFYSGELAKAEFIFPNNTVARIGGNTQFQLIKLDTDTIEADVASGTARFYNNGSAVIKCTTPIGYVLADTVTTFDVTVGESSAEITAISGKVCFIHTGLGNSRYDVIAGSGSIVVDASQVTAGTGKSNADWAAWNDQMDNKWSSRLAKNTESAKYVPQGLQQESYVLAENGRWENVVYEGQPRSLWRPTVVAASWSPFTNGRWVDYYGDQVWVPYESFGYVTHHYGNWVWVDACNCWYWAPPVTQYVATGPYLPVEYAWYPGRVSWVYTDVSVGWVPLHYSDPYYSPYWDSYYTYYGYDDHHGHHDHHDHHEHYNNYYGGDYTNINVNVNSLHYGDHAVVVSKANLYSSHDGYNNVRMNVRKQDLGSYHSQGHLNHNVVKSTGREGYQFSSKPAHFKPDQSANTRIKQNQMASRVRQGDNAKGYRNTMQQAKPGKMSSGPARSFQSVNRPQQGQHQQMQQNKPQPFQQKPLQQMQQNKPQPFQQKQQQMQQNKPQFQQKQQQRQQHMQQRQQPQQQKQQQNKPQFQQKQQRQPQQQQRQQQKQQSQPAKILNNKDKKNK